MPVVILQEVQYLLGSNQQLRPRDYIIIFTNIIIFDKCIQLLQKQADYLCKTMVTSLLA